MSRESISSPCPSCSRADWGCRPGVSSYATDIDVRAVEQTYVVGQEIKGMTFTTSRTGITVKDLVREYFSHVVTIVREPKLIRRST